MSEISISAGQLPNNYIGSETNLKMRIYCRMQFITSDSQLVQRGQPGSSDFYQEVDCDVSGTVISHDAFTIDSTLDGNPAHSWYQFDIYTVAGEFVGTAYKKIRVPATTSPRTLASLGVFNNAVCENLPNTYYPAAVIDEMFDDLVSVANKARDDFFGVTRMSAPSADIEDPIALAHSDPKYSGARQSYYLEEYEYTDAGLQEFIDFIDDEGNPEVELVVSDNLVIGPELILDVPANIHVVPRGNGIITTGADSQVTINSIGPLGNRRYFYGDGELMLGMNAVPELHLTWWAGISNSGDCTLAFGQAFRSMANQGENLGGGILRVGPGEWKCANATLSYYGTIIGAGRDPDGGSYTPNTTNGTVIRPYGTPTCIFRLPENYRMTTFVNLTISQYPSTTTAAILGEGDTVSGFMFRAQQCAFQGLNNGVPIIQFKKTGSSHWEAVQNVFDQCWWQVGENQQGFFTNTVNTLWGLRDNVVQVAKGGTAFKSEGRGWWVEINTDARGDAPVTDNPKTADRVISSASVSRTADDLENPFYSTMVLHPSTPADKQFCYNDIRQSVLFAGVTSVTFPAGFTAYITDIIDPFTARLSYYPPGGAFSAQAATVYRWDDLVGPAYAVRDFQGGNMTTTTIMGGIDEGFDHSLVYGSNNEAMLRIVNYNAQGKVRFTSATNCTIDGGSYPSCCFFDDTEGPLVILNISPGTYFRDDCGGNIYTKQGYVWGKLAQSSTQTFTRRPFDHSIRKLAANNLTDISYTNSFRQYHHMKLMDGVWGTPEYSDAALSPLFGLAMTKPTPEGDAVQKRMLRHGKVNFVTEEWEDWYDSFYSDYTKLLEFVSNRTDEELDPEDMDGGIKLRNMPLLTKRLGIDEVEQKTDKQGGLDYQIEVCGTVTQATSNSTAVTLNKLGGSIAMVNGNVTSGSQVTFRVNNSMFTSYKNIPWLRVHGDSAHAFSVRCTDASGDPANIATARWFDVTVKNESGSTVGTNITIIFGIVGVTWT